MKDYINYYDLLGIKKNSSKEEIKKAYKEQVKKWHPDVNKDENAKDIIVKLNEAKEILLDDSKRKEYDEKLNNSVNHNYDNLRKKQYHTENVNNNEEHYYTKWQYFKIYLKFYEVSKLRKFISFILVILESLFCSLLQITNFLLAIIITYAGELIYFLFTRLFGLYLFISILSYILKINSTFDWSITLGAFVLLVILTILLPIIPNLFINILPSKISKLNIHLFKKIIGYKD